MLTHLDLFTGIGGFHLAAEWAGFETIGFSEIEPYCCQLLAEKWPDIRNYGDIRTADFSGLRGSITVLSAGVPCQPASLAGKRRGSKDDRWLWPAVLDVVRTVQPAWVIFENPPGIVSLDEFKTILLCLATLGYETERFGVPANAVGADHLRYRTFIVANAEERGIRCGETRRQSGQPPLAGERAEALADSSGARCAPGQSGTGWQVRHEARRAEPGGRSDGSEALADRDGAGLEEHESRQSGQLAALIGSSGPFGFRLTEPPLCLRVDGVSSGLDGTPIRNRPAQLKALGNAVVPAQAYPFFRAIALLTQDSSPCSRSSRSSRSR